MIEFPQEYNNKTSITNPTEVISYESLQQKVVLLEKFYQNLGVKKIDQVGIHIKDQTSFLLNYIALWNLGATIVLFDQQIKSELFDKQISGVELNWLVTDKAYPKFFLITKTTEIFYYSISCAPGNLSKLYHNSRGFVILFTSGTENIPKPVVLKKDAILSNVRKVIEYTKLSSDDSTLLTLPLSYSYAMSQCLSHLLAGATIHFIKFGFLPELILDKIPKIAITNFAATPYFFEILSCKILEKKVDKLLFSNLRFFMNAGGFISPSTIKTIVNYLDNIKFFNNYGQTEASPRLSYACFNKNSEYFDGVGKPIKGVKIFTNVPKGQVGKIYYHSEDFMLGYYNDVINPTARKLNSKKVATGDIGKIIRDNELVLMGRTDDMIKLNGRKCYLLHIQNKIQQIDNIKHVKLIKKRHEQYGEYLEAIVVLSSYSNILELERIKQQFREVLPAHEIPKSIRLVKELTMTSNGKINKKDIEKINELHAGS